MKMVMNTIQVLTDRFTGSQPSMKMRTAQVEGSLLSVKALAGRTLFAFAIFLASGLAPAQGIDHAPFDTLLKANVKDGVVDYPGFQNAATFKTYLDQLAKPVTLQSPADKLAYYMNAYNAFAIQGIIDGLSPSSFIGRVRYFKTKEWALNGRSVSLYDLENKVIRPLGDPRIHFSIVCASRSCPKLRSDAYTSDKLEAQLDDNTRAFINDSFRNRFDPATQTAHLSEIFKWFDEDFIAKAGSVQTYLAHYLADREVAARLTQNAYEVEWIEYDWRLNGTPPRL